MNTCWNLFILSVDLAYDTTLFYLLCTRQPVSHTIVFVGQKLLDYNLNESPCH